MRRLFCVLGYSLGSLLLALIALVAIACSVAINGYFGVMRLGGELSRLTTLTTSGAVVIAVASLVAIDLLKAALPFFCLRAYHHRQHLYVFLGSVVIIGGVALSLLASFGFFLEQRTGVTAAHHVASVSLQSIETQISETRERIEAHGHHRPVATIKSELAAQTQHARWNSTKGCTDATARDSRTFCAAYHQLAAELGQAEAVATEQSKLEALLRQQTVLLGKGLRPTDPQLEALARASGWDTGTVSAVMFAVVAVMLEFVSAFGLLLAFGHGPKATLVPPTARVPLASPKRRQRQSRKTVRPKEIVAEPPKLLTTASTAAPPDTRDRVEELSQYGVARLEQVNGSAVSLTDLYADYRAWCEREARHPLGRPEFTKTLQTIAARVPEIEVVTHGRRKILRHMQLRRERPAA